MDRGTPGKRKKHPAVVTRENAGQDVSPQDLLAEHQVRILFEDNHLLVVHKPAGLSTQSDGRAADLLSLCREYIRIRYNKPGRAFLGLVHRLDRPVEGVVIFARTSKSAARLSEQFRSHTVTKIYEALVEGIIPDDTAAWTDSLAAPEKKNLKNRRARLAGTDEPGREARLSFQVIRRGPAETRVRIDLGTGRLHQIRLQFASRGFPIRGDMDYGSSRPRRGSGAPPPPVTPAETRAGRPSRGSRKDQVICLAAVELSVDHPVTGERLTFSIPGPTFAAEKKKTRA